MSQCNFPDAVSHSLPALASDARARAIAAVLGLVFLVLAAGARAQDRALTFAEAAQLTLARHPELRLAELDRQRAGARIDQAGLRPQAELATDLESFAGSGGLTGVDGAELTVSLASLFERGGKRNARIAVAEAEKLLLDVDQRARTLDLLAETGRRYVIAAGTTERLRIAREAELATTQTVAQLKPRVAAAQTPRTELLDAEVRQSQAGVARAAAERDVENAQLALGAQWSDLTARPNANLQWQNVPEPISYEDLLARLESVPDLARFATETRLREAQVRLAQSQAVADWRWSLGVRRYEASDEQALVAAFSVPLGASRRSAPFRREAEIELQRIEPLSASLQLRLKSALFGQRQLLLNARQRVLAITQTELPRAQEALALTERGYRIGRFPYRELAIVRAQVLELQVSRVETVIQYYLTNFEIERLTGAHLSMLAEEKK